MSHERAGSLNWVADKLSSGQGGQGPGLTWERSCFPWPILIIGYYNIFWLLQHRLFKRQRCGVDNTYLGKLEYFTNLNSSAIWGWFPLHSPSSMGRGRDVRSRNLPRCMWWVSVYGTSCVPNKNDGHADISLWVSYSNGGSPSHHGFPVFSILNGRPWLGWYG